jgi:hypothetical protein
MTWFRWSAENECIQNLSKSQTQLITTYESTLIIQAFTRGGCPNYFASTANISRPRRPAGLMA